MGSRSVIHPRFLSQTVGTLGRGGSAWTRTRTTGNGVTEDTTDQEAEITAYAWKASDLRQALGLAQTQLSETEWYVGGANGLDLTGNDLVTSQAEPGFTLLIGGPADDILPGMTLWEAEQQG